jgi:FdhD protein
MDTERDTTGGDANHGDKGNGQRPLVSGERRAASGERPAVSGERPADSFAPFRRVAVTRVGRAGETRTEDVAATEEPLEVRLHGKPFAVIMRTPGQDRELAAGFLLSEGILPSSAALGAVEHCRHPHHPDVHNIVDVYLMGDAARGLDRHLDERRNVLTNSSCGLCGRVTIDSLRVRAAPLGPGRTLGRTVAAALPDALRGRQTVFHETGGLHGAALFDFDGACDGSAEDVGRHNAVDKVIGAMLLADRIPLANRVLVVSGRASFEIVQKAWMAGVPIVCAISAPSSLAIELADEAGIALLGFVRNGGFNLYTHPERIGEA